MAAAIGVGGGRTLLIQGLEVSVERLRGQGAKHGCLVAAATVDRRRASIEK